MDAEGAGCVDVSVDVGWAMMDRVDRIVVYGWWQFVCKEGKYWMNLYRHLGDK